ncbi:hypothetical protein BD410DRAFT_782400 [Rickenella mellea]|uniref:L-ornithine N(5)-monooxygenase [NAD(P)H] n=1 Tax=Rickenella mellea TaxID=50990 RepID=A0A4Y7QJ94_9AGAM|nr:hypothetical protein BD410DRAFT_782400 [Rickenella mellea]
MPKDITDPQRYDIVGCGFGPSNLALAAALTDRWADSKNSRRIAIRNVVFIEKQPNFSWHPGMLLHGARMQISFMKDLVTLRCPTSPLTFISYLHAQNRLLSFIDRGSTIPTRREFADYLEWASLEVVKRGVQVAYSEEVTSISESESGLIDVTSLRGDGTVIRRQAKNLIISSGGSPRVPRPLRSIYSSTDMSAIIIHTSTYMPSVAKLFQTLATSQSPFKIGVVGSGQSAAEVFLDLHNRLSTQPAFGGEMHELDMIIRQGCLKPSDDSQFVNEIFHPQCTDMVFDLPTGRTRASLLKEYKNTNYGVVNPTTLETLFEAIYDQKLENGVSARTGRNNNATHQMKIIPYQSIISAVVVNPGSGRRQGIALTLQNTQTRELSSVTYDAIICGTGYERNSWLHLLRSSNLAKRFGVDGAAFQDYLPQPALIPVGSNSSIDLAGHVKENSVNYELERSASPSTPSSTDSSTSTPPTSPGLPAVLLDDFPRPSPNLEVTRHYQLLPRIAKDEGTSLHGRIYLQGYTEETHGLSETLLSVISVRAGEVIDDIWNAASGEIQ